MALKPWGRQSYGAGDTEKDMANSAPSSCKSESWHPKGLWWFSGKDGSCHHPKLGTLLQAVRLSEMTCRFVIRALQTSGYKWQKCSLLCLHPHKDTRAAAESSTLSTLHWILLSIPIDPHEAYLPLGAAQTSGGGAVQHRGWLESFIWGLPSLLSASDFLICFARECVCAEFLAEAREVRGFPQHPELRDQYWPQEGTYTTACSFKARVKKI